MRAIVNKKINTHWFKRVLEDRDMSQREYARLIKEDPTVVNRMFRGTRHFRLEDVRRFSEVTGAPVEAVLDNAGLDLDTVYSDRTVKISGWVDAQQMIHYGGSPGPRTVILPPDMTDGILAFRYKTNDANHGAVIYCRPLSDPTMDVISRWCVVRLTSGEEYVIVIKRGVRSRRFDLQDKAGITVKSDINVVAASLVEWVKY